MIQQYVITPAMGKRLIARGIAHRDDVREALDNRTIVIIAGTTNGYVAEEILTATGQADEFSRKGFRRGIVAPPGRSVPDAEFRGDVVLVKGVWQQGKTIMDVVGDLTAGDIVLKGANAVNLTERKAGVLIGDPNSGTIGVTVPVVAGRRVRLLIPVGLEKRIDLPIDAAAGTLNAPQTAGPRMMPMPGEVFTELDAIAQLTGATATIVSAGGVYGAEGAVWLAVDIPDGSAAHIKTLTESLASEGPCEA